MGQRNVSPIQPRIRCGGPTRIRIPSLGKQERGGFFRGLSSLHSSNRRRLAKTPRKTFPAILSLLISMRRLRSPATVTAGSGGGLAHRRRLRRWRLPLPPPVRRPSSPRRLVQLQRVRPSLWSAGPMLCGRSTARRTLSSCLI